MSISNIPEGYETFEGNAELGDEVRADFWSTDLIGSWRVEEILPSGSIAIRWTEAPHEAISPATMFNGSQGGGTRWLRKIRELKYDPTQQGDTDEDI